MTNPSNNTLRTRRQDNVILIEGSLTHATAVAALAQTLALFDDAKTLEINFAQVEHCDSSSIALLTALQRESKLKNIQLTFTNLPNQMQKLGVVSGVDKFLPIHESMSKEK
jgi:anti-anti-sigma factor